MIVTTLLKVSGQYSHTVIVRTLLKVSGQYSHTVIVRTLLKVSGQYSHTVIVRILLKVSGQYSHTVIVRTLLKVSGQHRQSYGDRYDTVESEWTMTKLSLAHNDTVTLNYYYYFLSRTQNVKNLFCLMNHSYGW